MKNNILFFCLLILFSFKIYAKVTWFLSKKESSHKGALVPSYKRSNFLGHILGGRVFIYPTSEKGMYLALSGYAGLPGKPARPSIRGLKNHWIYWMDRGQWSSTLEWAKTFDPFYKNESTERVEIPVEKKEVYIQYLHKFNKKWQMGLLAELKERKEKEDSCVLSTKETKKLPDQCYGFSPHELGAMAGIKIRKDERDNIFNPSEGYLFQTEVKGGYEYYNLNDIFLQLDTQISFIFSILDREKWVFNLALGGTLFDSKENNLPYSFQFKLGGMDHLRGYLQGRFHSGQYYLAQGEFRWPFFSWLECLLFLDLGNVSWFKKPLFSAGTGIRIGLPPSYDKKIRIEAGWGKDQHNFVVTFAYPY